MVVIWYVFLQRTKGPHRSGPLADLGLMGGRRDGAAVAAGRRFTGYLKLVARPCPDGHDSGPSHAKRCAYARSQASLLARPEQRGHFFIDSEFTR